MKENHPNSKSQLLKVLAAISVSIVNFGSFYAFDVPQELSEQLIIKYGVNQTQLNLTYTLYYLPNILFMLIIPYFASKIQTSYVILAASGTIFLGSALSAAGVPSNSWALVLAGRLIFGLGAEICLTSIDEFTE